MASLADHAQRPGGRAARPLPLGSGAADGAHPGAWVTSISARRGAALSFFVLVMVADTLLMFAMMGVLARFWMFAVSLALLVGLWLFILRRCHRAGPPHARTYRAGTYNRWQVYAGAFVLAWLITAIPCIYASYAKASGQLGYFRAIAASMAPTLRTRGILPGRRHLLSRPASRAAARSRSTCIPSSRTSTTSSASSRSKATASPSGAAAPS